jgi:hypothetical protein
VLRAGQGCSRPPPLQPCSLTTLPHLYLQAMVVDYLGIQGLLHPSGLFGEPTPWDCLHHIAWPALGSVFARKCSSCCPAALASNTPHTACWHAGGMPELTACQHWVLTLTCALPLLQGMQSGSCLQDGAWTTHRTACPSGGS